MIDLAHDALQAVEIAAPVLFGIWTMKRKEKKEMDTRHVENQQKLDELLVERKYLVPHDHNETEGPLTYDGLVRRKLNGK